MLNSFWSLFVQIRFSTHSVVANRKEWHEWETFTATVFTLRHVHVELDTVYCADTEDVTGSDSFYAIGAGVDRFSGKNNTVLSKPFQIHNGQTKSFPADTTQRVLFDGDVDAASTILLGIKFYDEDANRTWDNYGTVISGVAAAVSAGLAKVGGAYGGAAEAVVLVGTAATGLIMKLDKDDHLGDVALELPVLWQPIGASVHQVGVRGGSSWWSNWDCLVNLKVTVN